VKRSTSWPRSSRLATAEAKKALEEAVRWLDAPGGVLDSDITNAGRLVWDWRLETELLRREVQSRLDGK
jgi:hypothetical protein